MQMRAEQAAGPNAQERVGPRQRWVNDDNGQDSNNHSLCTVCPAWGGTVLPVGFLPAKSRKVLVSAEMADGLRCSTRVPGRLAPHESTPRVSSARLGLLGADRRTWAVEHFRQASGRRHSLGKNDHSEDSDRHYDRSSHFARHLPDYLPPESLVRMKTRTPNQASHATSEPAPDAVSSAHGG